MTLKRNIIFILIFSYLLTACQKESVLVNPCSTGKIAAYYEDTSSRGYLIADPVGKIMNRIPTDQMRFSSFFSFSLNGQSLIVGGSQMDFSAMGWYIVDIKSGTWKYLDSPPFQYGEPGGWFQSPDKSKIAMSVSHSDNFVHFYVKNSDGTNLVDLTGQSQNSEEPDDWSKDGQYILFDSFSPSNDQFTLNIVHPDGSGRKVIYVSNNDSSLYAQWSPDNTYLIVEETRYPPRLFLLKMDTLEKSELPSIPQNSYSPTWSPDGKCIAFLHGSGVYIYHLETQQVVELKNLERNNGYQWLDWSRR